VHHDSNILVVGWLAGMGVGVAAVAAVVSGKWALGAACLNAGTSALLCMSQSGSLALWCRHVFESAGISLVIVWQVPDCGEFGSNFSLIFIM
jgi:hypothetical protein